MLECKVNEQQRITSHGKEEVSAGGFGSERNEDERERNEADWGCMMCIFRCAGKKSKSWCGDFAVREIWWFVEGLEVCG